MNANVYQHFRKDEHPFVDLIEDWVEQVDRYYAPVLTNFLDPRQQFILESIVGQYQDDYAFMFFGGYEKAERKRALIYPIYYVPSQEDFDVTYCEITYPTKFATLTHGKILGTLMSVGLGREYFGDIITNETGAWHFICDKAKWSFVMTQVDKIANFPVKLTEISVDDLIQAEEEWEERSITASSMRVDTVISESLAISRQRAKQLIESKKVKLNWTEITRPDSVLEPLDIISIRGFGRIQVKAVDGMTKKQKYRIIIGIMTNNN